MLKCANAIGRQTRLCSMINPGYISPWIHSACAFYSSSQKLLQTQRQPAFVLKVQVVLKLFWTSIKKNWPRCQVSLRSLDPAFGVGSFWASAWPERTAWLSLQCPFKIQNDGKEMERKHHLEATQVLQPAQEKCIILLAHGAMIWLLPVSWLLWPTASCGRLGCTGCTGKS